MFKYSGPKIEQLKIEYYSIVGKLEIAQNVVISNEELELFEEHLRKCETEEEASSAILGATRRYNLLLREQSDETVMFPFVDAEIEELHCADEAINSTSGEEEISASSTMNDDVGACNTMQNNASSSSGTDAVDGAQADCKVFTNPVNFVKMDENRLATTREKDAIFIVYVIETGRFFGSAARNSTGSNANAAEKLLTNKERFVQFLWISSLQPSKLPWEISSDL